MLIKPLGVSHRELLKRQRDHHHLPDLQIQQLHSVIEPRFPFEWVIIIDTLVLAAVALAAIASWGKSQLDQLKTDRESH